jgi:hypothetical protein
MNAVLVDRMLLTHGLEHGIEKLHVAISLGVGLRLPTRSLALRIDSAGRW